MTETDLWTKVAKNVLKASRGIVNHPLTDTVIELMKTLINEEQAKFLLIFNKPVMNIDQIKEKTDLSDEDLEKMFKSLIDSMVIKVQRSRRGNIPLYYLMPLFPGIFEQVLLKGESGEKEIKISKLSEKIFEELVPGVQKKYDRTVKFYKNLPSIDRVIPVEEEIDVPNEQVLPFEDVKRLIENIDVIALAYCFCRHKNYLLNDPCKLNASRENCFYLGKFGEFLIEHDFARQISKEEARKILKESEDSGLVHKTFHHRGDPNLEEIQICSCCKCCCGFFDLYYSGALPIQSLTSYLSKVDKETCIGCGTCVERCPTEAIDLKDEKAEVNEDKCIGCGLCAHFCPEKAIKLERTGPRDVFIPMIKLNE